MKYDISKFDYNKYYYFIDDNNEIIEISRTSNDYNLESLKRKYFIYDGSRILNILFGIEGENTKKSFFKYLIIDFVDTNLITKQQIINFFIELLQQCDVIELKGKIVIVYYQDLDFDFKSILESINLDFFTAIKMFTSGKTYYFKPKYFSTIFNLILKLELFTEVHNKNEPFKSTNDYEIEKSANINTCINNAILVLLLVKRNYSAIKDIKPIILNNINEDSQCEKIIESMLKNNLNVSNAAKDLYMHRNTLNYKLDYIRSETGLNIQKFSDAMAMYWLMNAK